MFVRSLWATLFAMGMSALVMLLWGDLEIVDWSSPVLFWVPALVLTTPVAVAALYRRPGARGWTSAPERRWIFGGTMAAVGMSVVLALALVTALVLAVVDPASVQIVSGTDDAFFDAVTATFAVWLIVCSLLGLPVWLLVAGVAMGPGSGARQRAGAQLGSVSNV